jgi:hypothetical protein
MTLENLKQFVTSVSSKYPTRVEAILACLEKHWNANPELAQLPADWSAQSVYVEMSKRVPAFTAEMRAIASR